MKKPKITPELKEAVKAVIIARAYTQSIRPIIEDIQKTILNKFQYKYDPKYIDRRENLPEVITNIKHTWMMNDKDAGHYYTELHNSYLLAGFQVEFSYCPLLIAESTERDALHLMVEASKYIAASQGLANEAMERLYYKLEWIKQYQEAIIGLVISICGKSEFDAISLLHSNK